MRTLSSTLLAAVAAVPFLALTPSTNAQAQTTIEIERRSDNIGNYGYRDNSGYRSRGDGRRNATYGYRSNRGSGDVTVRYGARGYGYRDHGNYGYRAYSGYRPISYGYTSYGYRPATYGYTSAAYGYDAGCNCAPVARKVARYSYGYAPVAVAPVTRVRTHSYGPLAYGYVDDDDAYGYGTYDDRVYGYGYNPGISVGFRW